MDNNTLKPLKAAMLKKKRDIIVQAIIDCGFNKTKAAKVLNIDRKTIYNKLKEFKEAGL